MVGFTNNPSPERWEGESLEALKIIHAEGAALLQILAKGPLLLLLHGERTPELLDEAENNLVIADQTRETLVAMAARMLLLEAERN